MLTKTANSYLTLALSKASDLPHPNLVRALDARIAAAKAPQAKSAAEARKALLARVRLAAARAWDAEGEKNIRKAVLLVLRELSDDMQAHTTFTKALMRDCAFAAHIDCVRLEKAAAQVDEDMLNSALDAMAEAHPAESGDVPQHDKAEARRDSQNNAEYSEGVSRLPEGVVAGSADEAYDAIESLQAWLSLAYANCTDEQLAYWGLDGLFPLDQQPVETEFGTSWVNITDFDSYRAYQDAKWKARTRAVPTGTVDVEQAMLEA